MKNAEKVTFGGSGFNRAGDFRRDEGALKQMYANPEAQVLPVWRGKPLISGDENRQLAFLPPNHTVFQDAKEAPVFLGLEDDRPYFAHDISSWPGPDSDMSQIGNFIDNSEQTHPDLSDEQRFAELRRIMAVLSPRDAELAAMSVGIFSWHRSHRFCAKCGEPSETKAGGWQRNCTRCETQHFPRTDPVVIMLITRGNKVLIGRSHGWPEGMYSLLAGFMEPGETLEAAVRREVFEETGVRVGNVGYLASQPWPFPSSLMFGCYGEATTDEITIDKTEIEDAKWVCREEIADAWATKSSVLIAARKGAIAHFLLRRWLEDTLD